MKSLSGNAVLRSDWPAGRTN